MDPIITGFLASLAAGLATGVGALPALLLRKPSARLLDAMLGFAAGVMIAASLFGLLVPSFRLGGILITALGSILGVACLDRANLLIPHLHRFRGAEGPSATLQRVWLLLLAMVIHNIPEGLAVGIGFGQEDFSAGLLQPMAGGDLRDARRACRAGGRFIRHYTSHCGEIALAHRSGICRRRDAVRGLSRDHPRKPSARLSTGSHV
jgi:hypothetical protein